MSVGGSEMRSNVSSYIFTRRDLNYGFTGLERFAAIIVGTYISHEASSEECLLLRLGLLFTVYSQADLLIHLSADLKLPVAQHHPLWVGDAVPAPGHISHVLVMDA